MKPVYYRSVAHTEYEMCRSKTTYPSRLKAEQAHGRHRPYHCPYCKKWHLTSRQERKPPYAE